MDHSSKSPAMSPAPKRRKRQESGYSSSFSAASPFSIMPNTPATPMMHSEYSPMGAQLHSVASTMYSESESEDEMEMDKVQDCLITRLPFQQPSTSSAAVAAAELISKLSFIQPQEVDKPPPPPSMVIDTAFVPNLEEHSFCTTDDDLSHFTSMLNIDNPFIYPDPDLTCASPNVLEKLIAAEHLNILTEWSSSSSSPQYRQSMSSPESIEDYGDFDFEHVNFLDLASKDLQELPPEFESDLLNEDPIVPVAEELCPTLNADLLAQQKEKEQQIFVVQEEEPAPLPTAYVDYINCDGILIPVSNIMGQDDDQLSSSAVEPVPPEIALSTPQFIQDGNNNDNDDEIEQLLRSAAAGELGQQREITLSTHFIWDRIAIPIDTFVKAYSIWATEQLKNSIKLEKKQLDQSTLRSQILNKAAKALLSVIFQAWELKEQTLSGRKRGPKDPCPGTIVEASKLDSIRLLGIERLLGYLLHCWQEGIPLEQALPGKGGFNYKNALPVELSPNEIKNVEQHVYTQHRNQIKQGPKRKAAETRNNALLAQDVPEARLQQQLIGEGPDIEWTTGQFIARRQWAEAYRLMDPLKPQKAATVLFKAIFSEKEIQGSNISGRKGASILDPFKLEAIYEIVARLQNKTVYPYVFDAILRPEEGEDEYQSPNCPPDMKKLLRVVLGNSTGQRKFKKLPKKVQIQEEQQQQQPGPSRRSFSSPPPQDEETQEMEVVNIMDTDMMAFSFLPQEQNYEVVGFFSDLEVQYYHILQLIELNPQETMQEMTICFSDHNNSSY